MTDEILERVTADIKLENSKHYNVIVIRKINDVVKETYTVKANVICYNSRGFEKIKKSFMFMGYSTIILLHDPSLNKETAEPKLPRHEEYDIERKAKAALKEKHAQEEKDLIAQMRNEELGKKEKATGNGPGPVSTMGVGDLAGIDVGFSVPDATIEKLLDFSKENKIDLKGEKDETKVRKIVTDWLIAGKKK